MEIVDKTKLYYLSHPYTSYGDPIENQLTAAEIQMKLLLKYGIHMINSIVLLPFGMTDELAMMKCKHLYRACDSVILCSGWEQSIGCREEYQWAIHDRKSIYILDDKYELVLLWQDEEEAL